jgi:hypothetical protein
MVKFFSFLTGKWASYIKRTLWEHYEGVNLSDLAQDEDQWWFL